MRQAPSVVMDIPPALWQWVVFVAASGGWMPLAGFASESDAWEFGAKHLRARVYERDAGTGAGYTCRGKKDGFGRCWTDPMRVDDVEAGESEH